MNGIFSGGAAKYKVLVVVLILAVIVKIILDLYLQTKSGFLLRAVGDNANLVTSLAKDQGNVKILGLAIANGMVAMAGGIFCQEQRVFEISSGTGAIVVTSLAKDQGNVKILGLAIANGMVAMAGGIFCQEQRVFEISSGTGAIVIGLLPLQRIREM